MMNASIPQQIRELQTMSVAQLRERWLALNGESTQSRNKSWLVRRLAWRCQEIALGGLSETARGRLAELATDGFGRTSVPRGFAVSQNLTNPTTAAPGPRRDHRLPPPGSVITRRWRDRDLRLFVRDDGGFELDGCVYSSLSEAARGATGSRWSGWLFWGLRSRSRRT